MLAGARDVLLARKDRGRIIVLRSVAARATIGLLPGSRRGFVSTTNNSRWQLKAVSAGGGTEG